MEENLQLHLQQATEENLQLHLPQATEEKLQLHLPQVTEEKLQLHLPPQLHPQPLDLLQLLEQELHQQLDLKQEELDGNAGVILIIKEQQVHVQPFKRNAFLTKVTNNFTLLK